MSMNITSADVSRALERPVEWLLDIIRSAIVNVPGELVADIRDSGIQLCGGGALLEGIDQRLEKETGLAVRMSEHPQDDVVVGLGALASNDRLLNTLIRNGAAEGTVE